MSLGTILLVILILALVGMIPVWPHSRPWGYPLSKASENLYRLNSLRLEQTSIDEADRFIN